MLSWAAAVLAVTALVLAIGFSRHRLLLLAIVLATTIAARSEGGDRALQSALAFAPLLLLIAAVMPEARWRTKRNAGWLLLFAFALLLSLHAPEHVTAALDRFLIGLWPGAHPGRGAMAVVLVAAAACLLRWVLRGATAEWTASLALLATAIAFAHWSDAERALSGLMTAALLIVLGLQIGRASCRERW